MSTIQLSFLGPAELSRDGRPVELRAAKAIALAAYLAVTHTPQRREYLADLLWPDSPPDAARKNLRNTLWTLRQALGQEALIQPDADRIQIADIVWTDVAVFEAAAASKDAGEIQTALDLYRAPLLDGLSLAGAADFDLWLVLQRERFGQAYLRLLESLAASHKTEANWPAVIQVAHLALAADNLQEPMYRALMEAHARLGERARALRQYNRLRVTLDRELDVAPLPETEALRHAILTGGLPSAVVQDVHPRPRHGGEAREQPFVGRQLEIMALDQERQRAATGQVRVVLITGELGIGKTRLWHKWSQALPPPAAVLETHCISTTQALPFAPLIRLFTHSLCLESIARPDSTVHPVWLAELARLVPEIREHRPDIPAPSTLPPDEERRRLFEAFCQVLRAPEGDPLILFIDDLHWADGATLDWLIYLADSMAETPLLLVAAYRPQDAPSQLVRLVTGWKRAGLVRELPLAYLTPQEATQLIKATGGDPALAARLHAASAGNPYFMLEMGRAPAGDTPPVLAELVRARLNRLPGTARQVLQAAAILDADPDLSTMRRTSGRGEEETLDALDTLLAAGLLIEGETGYRFAQPLVATVVRQDLSDARRRFLHRRAAEALERSHAGNLTAVAGQLARHYSQAGLVPQAASYASRAAEHALTLAALDEAVSWSRQAWELEPAPTRRFELGQILLLSGDPEQGREALHRARDGFQAAGDSSGVARVCLVLAESYLPSGQGDQVLHWTDEALHHLGKGADPEARANAYYLLGAGNALAGHSLDVAEAHLHQAARLAAENDLPEMAARSEFERGNVLAQRGDLANAMRAFEKCIGLARAAGARLMEVLGHNNLAYHAQLAGDLVTAHEQVQAGMALARELSLFLPRQYLYSTQGEIALAEGDLDTAASWFDRALAEAQRYDNRFQAANIRANLGLVARECGDLDGALAHLQDARAMAGDAGGLHLQIQVDLWLAGLYLRRGEGADAGAVLAQAEECLADSGRKGLAEKAAGIRAALDAQGEQSWEKSTHNS